MGDLDIRHVRSAAFYLDERGAPAHAAVVRQAITELEILRSSHTALLAVLEPIIPQLCEVAWVTREYPHRAQQLRDIATALEAALRGMQS